MKKQFLVGLAVVRLVTLFGGSSALVATQTAESCFAFYSATGAITS